MSKTYSADPNWLIKELLYVPGRLPVSKKQYPSLPSQMSLPVTPGEADRTKRMPKILRDKPLVFRGVFFGPKDEKYFAIYDPYERLFPANTTSCMDAIVNSICVSLAAGEYPRTRFDASEIRTCQRKKWAPKNFRNRTIADHVTIFVEWRLVNGRPTFKLARRYETSGKHKLETAKRQALPING